MSRFPKAGRKPKNKPLSIFQQARRFYGDAFEAESRRDLADAMAEWSDLGAPERTFTLSHLLYLNLMALAGVQTLLHELLETVEDVADDFAIDDGDEDDDEDDLEQDDEPEDLDDAESVDEPAADEGELLDAPEDTDAPPAGVVVPGPAVITPAVNDAELDDLEDEPSVDESADPDEQEDGP